MTYLTAKRFKNNPLYLAVFLTMLLVSQITTTVSAHGAELEMRRIDDGRDLLHKNMGMSISELELLPLDRGTLKDGLKQTNKPDLYSELQEFKIDTTNLGARLGLSSADRIRLNSQVEAVRMESEEIGIRTDESIPLVPGILIETQWMMMDPPLRTEEITFYDRDTGVNVTKNWGALKHEEKIRLLSNTTDEVTINAFDSEAKVSVLGLGSTTAAKGRYKVVMDFTSYIVEDVLNKKDKKFANAKVGVGLRVVADVTTKKANVDLNGLPALSAAVKANKISGTMTITNIGIVPKNDSGTMISTVTINEDTVLNTMAMLAVLRSKMKDESTYLDPQVIWVKPIPYQVKPPVPTRSSGWPTFGIRR